MALAHPNHTAVGDRYVKLVAEGGQLRVVYSLAYGPIGAAMVRRSMDTNRDGRLTGGETLAGAVALAKRISKGARLTVGGAEMPLEWDRPFVAPAGGAVDASPLTIELSVAVPLEGGETVVLLEDLPNLEGIERSDYAFEAKPPADLLASGEGQTPTGQERLISMLDRRATGGRRLVSMRVRLPGATHGILGIVAFAAGTLAAGMLTGWLLRRRAIARGEKMIRDAIERRTGT